MTKFAISAAKMAHALTSFGKQESGLARGARKVLTLP